VLNRCTSVIIFDLSVLAGVSDLATFGLTVTNKFVDLNATEQHSAGIETHLLHLGQFELGVHRAELVEAGLSRAIELLEAPTE